MFATAVNADVTTLSSTEPPCTDPYARWCGRGGAERLPPIPIHLPPRLVRPVRAKARADNGRTTRLVGRRASETTLPAGRLSPGGRAATPQPRVLLEVKIKVGASRCGANEGDFVAVDVPHVHLAVAPCLVGWGHVDSDMPADQIPMKLIYIVDDQVDQGPRHAVTRE